MNKNQPKYYKLLSTRFILSVIENDRFVSESLREQRNSPKNTHGKVEYVFKPKTAYHNNVSYFSRNLINKLMHIEQVPIFLRRFPASKFYIENEISLYRWINYHYSNYLIMSMSLYDISLLLTNEVFLLGNEPRFCNEKSVAKHKAVKNTEVKKALDNIGEAIEEYRDLRHHIIHRGKDPAMGFIDDLETFDFLQKAGEELDIDYGTDNSTTELLMNPHIRNFLLRDERKKLRTKIEEKTDIYIDLINGLFNSLYPKYAFHTHRFSNLE